MWWWGDPARNSTSPRPRFRTGETPAPTSTCSRTGQHQIPPLRSLRSASAGMTELCKVGKLSCNGNSPILSHRTRQGWGTRATRPGMCLASTGMNHARNHASAQNLKARILAKTGADVRVRTSAGANNNTCPPQESRQQGDAVKLGGCMFPSRHVCFKIEQISKSGFSYTGAIN
jgi:hypothetical protein